MSVAISGSSLRSPPRPCVWRNEAKYPPTTEGDFVVHNFKFHSGESLPEVRLHYTTLGKPAKDAQGRTTNAVLILHGTGGTGHQFLAPYFANELFNPGQLLDASRYYLILVDGVGHGKSSKPSDGLHAHFPAYDYDDMVALHHKLLTEGLGVNHSAADFRHIDGLHAFVRLGRDVSRFHGRADADGVLARANRRTQPHVAKDGDGWNSQRSRTGKMATTPRSRRTAFASR